MAMANAAVAMAAISSRARAEPVLPSAARPRKYAAAISVATKTTTAARTMAVRVDETGSGSPAGSPDVRSTSGMAVAT
jgi:hypothetical protein